MLSKSEEMFLVVIKNIQIIKIRKRPQQKQLVLLCIWHTLQFPRIIELVQIYSNEYVIQKLLTCRVSPKYGFRLNLQ